MLMEKYFKHLWFLVILFWLKALFQYGSVHVNIISPESIVHFPWWKNAVVFIQVYNVVKEFDISKNYHYLCSFVTAMSW